MSMGNRLRIVVLLATLITLCGTCVALPAAAQQRPGVEDPGTRHAVPSGGRSWPGRTSRFGKASGGRSVVYEVPAATATVAPSATPASSGGSSSNVARRRKR